jgi:hypothetical protein
MFYHPVYPTKSPANYVQQNPTERHGPKGAIHIPIRKILDLSVVSVIRTKNVRRH